LATGGVDACVAVHHLFQTWINEVTALPIAVFLIADFFVAALALPVVCGAPA